MAAALAAALIAVPAQAKKPEHAGPPDDRASTPERGHGQSGRCKVQKVGWGVRGEVVEATLSAEEDGRLSGDVVVDVRQTTAHARAERKGEQPKTYTVTDVRGSFDELADRNGDGAVGAADVAPGDEVKLLGSIAKPKRRCPAPDPAAEVIRKAIFHAPEAEDEPEA
jgi:hypothetical protein